jgi:hypothetical protein
MHPDMGSHPERRTSAPPAARQVEGRINYLGDMAVRPRFYAVDYSRDNLVLDGRSMPIRDARFAAPPPSLDREGFTLVPHRSAVSEFRDLETVQRVYLPEVQRLMLELTGAERILMTPGAVLRFGERSKEFGSRVNTRPARFVHVDYTPQSAPGLLNPLLAAAGIRLGPGQRYAGYNIWRVLSDPPQDVPLALCDARTVAPEDLVAGDAVFDAPNQPEWGFEAFLVRGSPAHRWSYFSNMTRDEALIFKACDTDSTQPVRVPHVAFDDPACPPDVPPRASVEVRCFALF